MRSGCRRASETWAEPQRLRKKIQQCTRRTFCRGDRPEMMIRHWGPDTDIPVHSHPYHEMFYVLEGEVEIGGTTYGAGSCIYIEKNTPYGPTRAPKGGKVLRYAEAGVGR